MEASGGNGRQQRMIKVMQNSQKRGKQKSQVSQTHHVHSFKASGEYFVFKIFFSLCVCVVYVYVLEDKLLSCS